MRTNIDSLEISRNATQHTETHACNTKKNTRNNIDSLEIHATKIKKLPTYVKLYGIIRFLSLYLSRV